MQTLSVEINDAVATIAFNRPEAMNTYNHVMAKELLEATEQIKADATIRAVVLRGNGALFMAGGDIQFFAEHLDDMPSGVPEIIQQLTATIVNLQTMPKPVLAVVHGSVAGVGMSFMAAADLVLAAENTVFTLAYSGIGITPDGGASYFLPRLVGTKIAMEMILLGERFSSQDALQHGLINWSCPVDDLWEMADKRIKTLSQGPTQVYARAKKLIVDSWQNTLEEQCQAELDAFAACSAEPDFRQGVTAFIQRQPPTFTGKS